MGKPAQELSPEAVRVMARGLREGLTARMIAGLIERECGEQVSERTLSRRISEWRAGEQRRKAKEEDAAAMVKAMKEGNVTAAEMVQALTTQALIEEPERFRDSKGVFRTGLAAQELRLKERTLAVKERAVAAIERRVKILEDREKRAVEALSGTGEKMTPEERLKEIREIYGIRG